AAGMIDRQAGAWLERITQVAREHEVVGLVIGLPRRTGGELGSEAEGIVHLGRRLAGRLGLPVVYWDERLTTRMAEQALIEGGVSRRRRRSLVDQTAAVLILQSFLDALRVQGREPAEAADAGSILPEEEFGPKESKKNS
ncbi:MAG TPA: Holliday junction resolvase RuvX, partial [Limnochorda sp.]